MNRKLAVACIAGVLSAGAAVVEAKIVCWKDKSGKVVGCGDAVPPEYQEGATKELDSRGITRRTTESAEAVAKRRAREEEAARVKAESDRRAAEQRRQDTALLNTFASEQEIDGKRDRDLQVIELQVKQLRMSLQSAVERHNEAQSRHDLAQRSKRGASDALKEEAARTAADIGRLEQSIAAKEKEQHDIRARYAEYRKRYAELKTGTQASASAGARR